MIHVCDCKYFHIHTVVVQLHIWSLTIKFVNTRPTPHTHIHWLFNVILVRFKCCSHSETSLLFTNKWNSILFICEIMMCSQHPWSCVFTDIRYFSICRFKSMYECIKCPTLLNNMQSLIKPFYHKGN